MPMKGQRGRCAGNDKAKGKENTKSTPAMLTETISKPLDPNALEWSFPANTVSYTLEEGQAQYLQAKSSLLFQSAFSGSSVAVRMRCGTSGRPIA